MLIMNNTMDITFDCNYNLSHELPEIKASSKVDTMLCNGDLSEAESDSEELSGKLLV